MKPDPRFKCAPEVQLLPSAGSALAFARGDAGSGWAVLSHLAARTLVVAPAVIAVGHIQGVSLRKSLALGLAASVAIEAAVIYLAFRQVKAEDQQPAASVLAAMEEGIKE
jgi:hypothetical protein